MFENSREIINYIKLAIIYIVVYSASLFMFVNFGLNIYISIVSSVVVTLFVHDVIYSNRKISSSSASSSSMDIDYTEEKPEENNFLFKITQPHEVKLTLQELIGLGSVKENIENIVNLIKVEKKRGDKPVVGHYIFQGNPGTGKTTVGRILGKTFKKMKFLSKGHFIEVTRDDLVGQYLGHTAQKTTAVLEAALGGVLFIDEAYSLLNDEKDFFGIEALNTIVPFMENHRDDLVVIIAGYTEPLDKFLNANVGFKSRFDYTIDFDDYTPKELYKIFLLFANKFTWDDRFDMKLRKVLNDMYMYKTEHFGNARDIRKLFDSVKRNQSNRIAPKIKWMLKNDKSLYRFEYSDIRYINT